MTSANLGRYVAINLRRLRVERGLSQEAFAHLAGLNRTYVGAIEREEFSVTVATLARLANTLGVDPCLLISPPPRGTIRSGLSPGRKPAGRRGRR